MATTAIGLRYPIGSDNNDTATAVQNLASDIDPMLEGSYTQTEINALAGVNLWTGRRVFNSTRGCYQWYTGAAWIDEQGVVLNAQAASYTLVLADGNNKLVTMSNAGAINFSVPTNASVAFPIGTVINGVQLGAGQVTIVAVTPGTTTISSAGGANKTRLQYSGFTITKIATDIWLLVGDIV